MKGLTNRCKIIILLIVIIVGFSLAVWLINRYADEPEARLVEKPADFCISDTDCVPAGCCHSSSCTSKYSAPKCDYVFCTEVCQPGTLDCGQASCLCINNKCKVVSKTPA